MRRARKAKDWQIAPGDKQIKHPHRMFPVDPVLKWSEIRSTTPDAAAFSICVG